MVDDCLFCAIIAGEEDAEMVRKEDRVVAFEDKFPQAPVHVLIVPREHIASANELSDGDDQLLSDCFRLAREIAEDNDTAGGYRIVTNVGRSGGQAIDHLHFHVLGGRQLGGIDSGG